MRIHLNLGSNQGDRRAIIGRAVALIARDFAPARVRLSDYVESAPWGYNSPHPFLNRAAEVTLSRNLDPTEVLRRTQQIERAVAPDSPHRNADGTYRDRRIDIDIIDIDGMTLCTPELTLPHPGAAERAFVIGPLAEIDPETAKRLVNGYTSGRK